MTGGRCAVVLACVAACTTARHREPPAAGDGPIEIEPDDVAILMPLVGDSGYLTASSEGRGGALLPRDVYERAFGTGLQLGGTPAAPARDRLRVVAIRLDPCFAALGPIDDAHCTNQIRLVFQTLDFSGPRTVADDTAVHVFYAIDRADLVDAVRQLAATHAGTRLGKLAPHPLLVAQGLRGPAARVIARVVLRLAGAANLTRITAFTSSGLGTAWNFFGADVASDHRTSPVAIPTLPDARLESFFAGFVEGQLTGDPAFTPWSTELAPRDDLRLLAHGGRGSASERERAALAATRIEDPTLHSPDTIDCVSCHVARSLREQSKIDVHMFGYKGAAPAIQPRTVHEVDATVAYLRRAR